MAASSGLLRWLQRKKYQFEVTLPMYMMTPTENVVLCSFLFIFFSMIVIAIAVYLPEHVTTIFSRAWFYYAGDDSTAALARPASGGSNAVAFTGSPISSKSSMARSQQQQTLAASQEI